MFNKPLKRFSDGRQGPSRYFGKMRFFACEGMIVIMDERPTRMVWQGRKEVEVEEGDCKIVAPNDFKNILNNLAQALKYRNKTDAELPQWRRSVRKKLRSELQAALLAVAEAKAQGDPTDPKVQAYWSKHYGRNATLVTSLLDMTSLPETTAETALAKPATVREAKAAAAVEAQVKEQQQLKKAGMLKVDQLILPINKRTAKDDN